MPHESLSAPIQLGCRDRERRRGIVAIGAGPPGGITDRPEASEALIDGEENTTNAAGVNPSATEQCAEVFVVMGLIMLFEYQQ